MTSRRSIPIEQLKVGSCWRGRNRNVRGRVIEITDNHYLLRGLSIPESSIPAERGGVRGISVKILHSGPGAILRNDLDKERDISLMTLSENYSFIKSPTQLELYQSNMNRLDRNQGEMMHCPMPVTIDGRGPANDHHFHHWSCWCPDGERCKVIFKLAWRALSEVAHG